MKSKTVFKWFGVINLIVLSIACTRSSAPEKSNHKNLTGSIAQLISTRPEKSGPAKVIIRLPADPLAKVPKEEWAEQLTLIRDQQKTFTDQLAAISNEIKIIYTYKTILNGMYVVIPESQVGKVDKIIPAGSHVELSTSIQRPETINSVASVKTNSVEANSAETNNKKFGDVKAKNSVKFIGADVLHVQGIKGQGIKVGIIDTGIDYTHSMLGGTGSAEDYKKIVPDQPTPLFPNSKVVGGYDFVGTEYNSAAPDVLLRIPKPDPNPLDESGHGTHVAGTVAGMGDGMKSYDGVAPEAQLYALKVFGAEGSTDDAIVIAALEFAADPDGNIETKNPLDVVNLSLGSPFGNPKILYKEAIANLNALGTVVVASAGNSGNVNYITGSPAVSDDAFSIAASIDDMDHNWHFPTAAFTLSADNTMTTEIVEATFTKQLETIDQVSGKVVYLGLGKEITNEQAALVKGHIALIDRGEITFSIKIKNALNAGASAVIIANNVEGSPLAMGGENEKVDIPAVMISLAAGNSIKAVLAQGAEVLANLKNETTVAKPELIDTLTSFSSRGPRSEDSIIKPEIAAPGANIISAKVGGGSEIVPMSGTSMAAPHMAGVMALLKQTHPALTAQELKSLTMLTAKSINDDKGVVYPVALQGAGRVRVDAAISAGVAMVPAAISLGRSEIVASKTISKKVKVKNLETQDITLNVEPKLSADLVLVSPKVITLTANEEKVVDIQIKIKSPNTKTFDNELDGFLQFIDQNKKVYSVPVLAMVLKISQVTADALKVHSAAENDSTGSLAELNVKNSSPHAGAAYLFNLLATDEIKDDTGINKKGLSTACDLESVGYRTVFVENKQGQKVELLQMALKLYNPLTTWNMCEFSVQIDGNGDGIADQELAGANRSNTEGLGAGMASLLLDANKAREIRKAFEAKLATHTTPAPVLNFSEAVEALMPAVVINQSTLMIIQTPVANLKAIPGQNLRVKVGALNLEEGLESNDFLQEEWMRMPLNAQAQAITDIPSVIEVPSNGTATISLTKGEGANPVILYFPYNHASMTSAGDKQSQSLSLEFVGVE